VVVISGRPGISVSFCVGWSESCVSSSGGRFVGVLVSVPLWWFGVVFWNGSWWFSGGVLLVFVVVCRGVGADFAVILVVVVCGVAGLISWWF